MSFGQVTFGGYKYDSQVVKVPIELLQDSAFDIQSIVFDALQRRIGASGRVVAEGRDMGTVVFPGARAKFFLTAPIEERARRRTLELAASGRPQDFDAVLAEMRLRDQRDSTRAVAPLRRAENAIEIDTAGLSPEDVVARMAALVRERGG